MNTTMERIFQLYSVNLLRDKYVLLPKFGMNSWANAWHNEEQ